MVPDRVADDDRVVEAQHIRVANGVDVSLQLAEYTTFCFFPGPGCNVFASAGSLWA